MSPAAARATSTQSRPASTLVIPTRAAVPATIVAADFDYPPDTRTGVTVLDAISDAVLANDPTRVRELTHFTPVGCTTAQGLAGRPSVARG